MTARKGEIDAWVAATLAAETDDCIEWPFAGLIKGYGHISRGGKSRTAHAYVCEIAHGPAPTPEHEAAHSCRSRRCCNKRHLRWATGSENQMDRVKDGTSNRGERHGLAKLTVADVAEIRQLAGLVTHANIAIIFSISRVTVSDIVNRRRWPNVP